MRERRRCTKRCTKRRNTQTSARSCIMTDMKSATLADFMDQQKRNDLTLARPPHNVGRLTSCKVRRICTSASHPTRRTRSFTSAILVSVWLYQLWSTIGSIAKSGTKVGFFFFFSLYSRWFNISLGIHGAAQLWLTFLIGQFGVGFYSTYLQGVHYVR